MVYGEWKGPVTSGTSGGWITSDPWTTTTTVTAPAFEPEDTELTDMQMRQVEGMWELRKWCFQAAAIQLGGGEHVEAILGHADTIYRWVVGEKDGEPNEEKDGEMM